MEVRYKYNFNNMSYCSKCGSKIDKENKFCARCGSAIERKAEPCCSRCGKRIESKDKYCGDCGVTVASEVTPKEMPKPLNDIGIPKAKSSGTKYFCVSFGKLLIMTVLTLGIYPIYWFYKNWKAIKIQENENLHPLWRAWFWGIYSYSLFKRILDSSEKQGYNDTYGAATLYVTFILGVLLTGADDDNVILTGVVILLFPVYIIQQAIEFNNSKIKPDLNKKGS